MFSRAPYGYRKVEANDGDQRHYTLEPETETAAIVRRIYDESLNGSTDQAIARGLNYDGIPCLRDRQWKPQDVRRIRQNEVNCGTLIYGKEDADNPVRVQNAFPPIVSREDFDRVQLALEQPRNPTRPGRNRASLIARQPTPDPSLPGPTGQGLLRNFRQGRVVIIPPRILGHAREEHQVQRVLLIVGYPAEIVPEEEGWLAQGYGNSELDADTLIRRAAINHREDGIALLNVTAVSLPHPVGPAGPGEIDLVISGEGLPDLQPKILKGFYQFWEQELTLLLRKAVGASQVDLFHGPSISQVR